MWITGQLCTKISFSGSYISVTNSRRVVLIDVRLVVKTTRFFARGNVICGMRNPAYFKQA